MELRELGVFMTLKVDEIRDSDPVFKGLYALLDVIRTLIDRPRWQRKEGEIRGDRTLPLLCLIREQNSDSFLRSLSRRLGQASPDRVPHVWMDAEKAAEKSARRWATVGRRPPLLPLLDELHNELVADRFGRERLGRFRHYRLADWLTGHKVEPSGGRADRSDLIEVLRQWYRQDRAEAASAAPFVRLANTVFAAWHRPLRFPLWARGLPVFGPEPRWFMRQPFMVPRHSLTFAGFAERLTVGRRDTEEPDQLKKLLVHAFLEDLRVLYAPRRLRLRRWRRTAYPVVALDNVTEHNGGWELLRLINDVRNERGDLDPLLVIAGSAHLPVLLQDAPREVLPVHKVKTAVTEWERRLPERRQRMTGDARFVAVYLSDTNPSDADEAAWSETQVILPRKPAWLARRWALPAVLVTALAAGTLTVGAWAAERVRQSCVPDPSAGVAANWRTDLRQCVGYSDDADLVFGTDERLTQAQRAIFEQNAIAEALHAANPARPLVSIVYFAALTRSGAAPNADQSVAEELEGLLVQQHERNHPRKTELVLRVVVANGGNQMTAAADVARQLLVPLFQDDPTLLGVVGMDRTVPQTEEAIAVLGHSGVPVVATTLTGEGLPARSPLYFQLVPGNSVQASLLVKYAQDTGRLVTVYHPPLTDGYMKTLVNEVKKATGPYARKPRSWKTHVDEVDVRCGRGEIAFYAGRETQFADFLQVVVDRCTRENLPTIVGDDATNRFIAQPDDRNRSGLNQLPVSWVDMGSLVVLAGASCRTQGLPTTSSNWSPLLAFCAGYHWLHQRGDGKPSEANAYADILRRSDQLPWAGQHVGLAYDAAGLFVRAVREYRKRPHVDGTDNPPQRGAIAQEFREFNTYDGATGVISFRKARNGSNRNLAILTIDNIRDMNAVPTCESIVGNPFGTSAGNGCPE